MLIASSCLMWWLFETNYSFLPFLSFPIKSNIFDMLFDRKFEDLKNFLTFNYLQLQSALPKLFLIFFVAHFFIKALTTMTRISLKWCEGKVVEVFYILKNNCCLIPELIDHQDIYPCQFSLLKFLPVFIFFLSTVFLDQHPYPGLYSENVE